MKDLANKKTNSRFTSCGLVAIALFIGLSTVTPRIGLGQVARTSEAVALKVALRDMLQAEGAKSLKKLTVTVGAEETTALLTKRGVKLEGVYTVYKGVDESGALVGTVVIVDEEGKEGPLQMVIAFRPDGQIYDIGFTVFGEDRGKPALSWPFVSQFIGKDSEKQLVLGKGIDAITGATWTSNSVAAAVRKGIVLYDEFVKQGG